MAVNVTSMPVASLIICIGLLAGCNGHSGSGMSSQGASINTASKSVEKTSPTSQPRFIPIKPSLDELKSFNYKVYEFASDGSWVSIVPMPPRGGDIVIGVLKQGGYEAKLTNPRCAYPVHVTSNTGGHFILTADKPKHDFIEVTGSQLSIKMDDSAKNNYFCNTAIVATPK